MLMFFDVTRESGRLFQLSMTLLLRMFLLVLVLLCFLKSFLEFPLVAVEFLRMNMVSLLIMSVLLRIL